MWRAPITGLRDFHSAAEGKDGGSGGSEGHDQCVVTFPKTLLGLHLRPDLDALENVCKRTFSKASTGFSESSSTRTCQAE